MIAGVIVTAFGTRLRVTEHALTRYRQRVVPDLTEPQAFEHLTRLTATRGRLAQRPGWVLDGRSARRRCRWLELDQDLGALIDGDRLVTIIVHPDGSLLRPRSVRRLLADEIRRDEAA